MGDWITRGLLVARGQIGAYWTKLFGEYDLNWIRFFSQSQRDLKFWLFGIAFFALFRACFILLYRGDLSSETKTHHFLVTFLNGARYDSQIVCYCIVPSLLLSIACGFKDWAKLAEKVRVAMASAFAITASIICVLDVGFYREFKDQFNYMIFGIWYDDTSAVLQTIWKTYPIFWYFLAIGVAGGVMVWGLRRWLQRGLLSDERMEFCRPHVAIRIVLTTAIFVGFVGGIRGSIGRRPAQLKDAATTPDQFLNKCVMNPVKSIVYAVKHYNAVMGGDGLKVFIPDGDLKTAVKHWNPDLGVVNNLDNYLQRVAVGPKGVRPRHIFLIVMESCEAWPMYEEYTDLKMADGIKELAQEGLWVRNFLSSSDGTMSSLSAIITGLPDAGVVANYQPMARRDFPTSIAPIFKKLGYRTKVYYGGYLSWQRLGDFALNQGFDEVWGGAHMQSWSKGNEWGVDDEFIFKFVLGKTDESKPTFNLIMTTSHHPPFDLDVEKYIISDLPESIRSSCQDDVDFNRLAHYAYADREMAKFAKEAVTKNPESLFVITGDHIKNYYIKKHPDPLKQASVPLVLYGPEVLRGLQLPDNVAGSHLDIIPTLVELSAPKGFDYHALGNDLLVPQSRFAGVARYRVVTSDAIYFLKPSGIRTYPLSSGISRANLAWQEEEVKLLHDTIHGIGWWRIKKGPRLD